MIEPIETVSLEAFKEVLDKATLPTGNHFLPHPHYLQIRRSR